jgi:OFA family oxalate/formate antiporter-like MFS transporter
LFLIVYASLFGIGIGFSYLTPLMCAWNHYPQKKGLVTGIILGSFGLGSFIFDLLSTYICNPYNIPPSIDAN